MQAGGEPFVFNAEAPTCCLPLCAPGWQADAHRVVDVYLCEGPKALVRFGLGLLRLTKRRIKRCGSATDVADALHRWLQGSGDGFQRAYSFGLLQVGGGGRGGKRRPAAGARGEGRGRRRGGEGVPLCAARQSAARCV